MESHKRPIKTTFNSNFSIQKLWKESPPGPEQKELERLFANNLISVMDSPNQIMLKHPIFKGFTERVFLTHFKKTKAKMGLNCK